MVMFNGVLVKMTKEQWLQEYAVAENDQILNSYQIILFTFCVIFYIGFRHFHHRIIVQTA